MKYLLFAACYFNERFRFYLAVIRWLFSPKFINEIIDCRTYTGQSKMTSCIDWLKLEKYRNQTLQHWRQMGFRQRHINVDTTFQRKLLCPLIYNRFLHSIFFSWFSLCRKSANESRCDLQHNIVPFHALTRRRKILNITPYSVIYKYKSRFLTKDILE